MPTVYFSLGSNLGERAENLRTAITRLEGPSVQVQAVSHIYETVPVGETPEPVPMYLNCAIKVETNLAPLALLEYAQNIERAGQRVATFRWGPRTIDIDLLLYDNLTLDTERLTVPHPRLTERAFVLIPLAEIVPGIILPNGVPVIELLQNPVVRAQEIRMWNEV